jgi:hypothetical protein
MRAEVDLLIPEFDGARQAADVRARLENLDVGAPLGKLIARSDSRGTRADDADSHGDLDFRTAMRNPISLRKSGIRMRQKQSTAGVLPKTTGKTLECAETILHHGSHGRHG